MHPTLRPWPAVGSMCEYPCQEVNFTMQHFVYDRFYFSILTNLLGIFLLFAGHTSRRPGANRPAPAPDSLPRCPRPAAGSRPSPCLDICSGAVCRSFAGRQLVVGPARFLGEATALPRNRAGSVSGISFDRRQPDPCRGLANRFDGACHRQPAVVAARLAARGHAEARASWPPAPGTGRVRRKGQTKPFGHFGSNKQADMASSVHAGEG
jgi:hypothetical protein